MSQRCPDASSPDQTVITDITFTSFDPREDAARFNGILTFTDKSTMSFELGEIAPEYEKSSMQSQQQQDYVNGKWHIFVVFDSPTGLDAPPQDSATPK